MNGTAGRGRGAASAAAEAAIASPAASAINVFFILQSYAANGRGWRAVLLNMKRLAFVLAGLSLLALPGTSPDRASPFRTPRVLEMGAQRRPEALAAADFNGDGKLDLAVGSGGSDDLVILLGDGKGGFRTGGTFPA